ncbi:MAG: HAD hydrolase-like protein [Verrucomicrobiota bacterium]
MIGDREQDIDAAHANGVAAVAVGWGFGSPEVLRVCAPEATAATIDELRRLLIGR